MDIKGLDKFKPAKEQPKPAPTYCPGVTSLMQKVDALKFKYPHLSDDQIMEMVNLTQDTKPESFKDL